MLRNSIQETINHYQSISIDMFEQKTYKKLAEYFIFSHLKTIARFNQVV